MSMMHDAADFADLLQKFQDAILATYALTIPGEPLSRESAGGPPVLPESTALYTSASALLPSLPENGLGLTEASTHLLDDVLPGLNQSSLSPHYYGFVTGGATPAALLADLLASTLDQNVQVHLPAETLATVIEDRTLTMLLELFRLSASEWAGRTFTTGATGSNIIGLACAREALLQKKLGAGSPSVGELGLLEACHRADIAGFQVLGALAHSSVPKAASVVGIGRANVHDIGRPGRGWELDLKRLEETLKTAREERVLSIVAVSYGEVNTGRFDSGLHRIRELVDVYGGWIHVDAAFGIFARCLDLPERAWADGLELADSITGDGHKLLNVPYDCGFFFTRSAAPLQSTLLNAAPYLAAPAGGPTQPSPLNINLENSRRFRALPAYATLAAYGAAGYRDLMMRLVAHARGIAAAIQRRPAAFELLATDGNLQDVFMVVLFRATDENLNKVLKDHINATRRMYVSGTVWDGRPAVRCAVGNWRVGTVPEGPGGWDIVESVLDEVAAAAVITEG